MNDQQLLAAYLQGDECALEDLIARYHRLVSATAARAVGDAHLAQDITQTVFIIFARKARRLSNEVSLPGWFLRTARFVARDAIKKLARRARRRSADCPACLSQVANVPDARPARARSPRMNKPWPTVRLGEVLPPAQLAATS